MDTYYHHLPPTTTTTVSSFVPTALTQPFFELETWDFACNFILTLMMMSTTTTTTSTTTTTKKNVNFFFKVCFFQHFFWSKIFFQQTSFSTKNLHKKIKFSFFTKNLNFEIIQLLINWFSTAVTNCLQLCGWGVCYQMELATASLACYIPLPL